MDTFANICERGHVIEVDLPEPGLRDADEPFCQGCGRPVLAACPRCDRPIPGAEIDYLWGIQGFERPAYCRGCGEPFQWTEWALSELDALVDADTDVPADGKAQLKDDLRELTHQEPAPSAVKRARTFIAKVLKDPATRQIAINTISEAAKQMMSGH